MIRVVIFIAHNPVAPSTPGADVRVVDLGRSTCHAIIGRGNQSTRLETEKQVSSEEPFDVNAFGLTHGSSSLIQFIQGTINLRPITMN